MSDCHNPNYIGPKWDLVNDLFEKIESLKESDDYQYKFLIDLLKRIEELEEQKEKNKISFGRHHTVSFSDHEPMKLPDKLESKPCPVCTLGFNNNCKICNGVSIIWS